MSNTTIYADAKDRIVGLVNDNNADTPVPTCPGWSVKDLVAHLTGLLVAFNNNDINGAQSREWGEQQVKDRINKSLLQCIDEWDAAMKDATPVLEGKMAMVAVSDILSHEQDIRTALGQPGAQDVEGWVPSIQMGLAFMAKRNEAAGLPALRIVTPDLDEVVGEGEPQATLKTSTFELARALHGRRTLEQVAGLDWEGDPQPFMETFFMFGPPTEKKVEE